MMARQIEDVCRVQAKVEGKCQAKRERKTYVLTFKLVIARRIATWLFQRRFSFLK
ncbi:MAG: hypothetical protein LBB51_00605 [Zoogloeaceae bacterium]|jgi:hypothetical protein|nr:hypothetical protein [Zoogloeaceae bacterium]